MNGTLFINEDNLVEWSGAKLASDDSYVSTGTCAWELKDSDGAQVATGSLACTDASTGTWQGTIPKTATADLVLSARYSVEVTLTSGTDDGFRKMYFKAGYHGER